MEQLLSQLKTSLEALHDKNWLNSYKTFKDNYTELADHLATCKNAVVQFKEAKRQFEARHPLALHGQASGDDVDLIQEIVAPLSIWQRKAEQIKEILQCILSKYKKDKQALLKRHTSNQQDRAIARVAAMGFDHRAMELVQDKGTLAALSADPLAHDLAKGALLESVREMAKQMEESCGHVRQSWEKHLGTRIINVKYFNNTHHLLDNLQRPAWLGNVASSARRLNAVAERLETISEAGEQYLSVRRHYPAKKDITRSQVSKSDKQQLDAAYASQGRVIESSRQACQIVDGLIDEAAPRFWTKLLESTGMDAAQCSAILQPMIQAYRQDKQQMADKITRPSNVKTAVSGVASVPDYPNLQRCLEAQLSPRILETEKVPRQLAEIDHWMDTIGLVKALGTNEDILSYAQDTGIFRDDPSAFLREYVLMLGLCQLRADMKQIGFKAEAELQKLKNVTGYSGNRDGRALSGAARH